MTFAIHQNIPDSSGMNIFTADPAFGDLLRVYLSKDDYARALPHFEHMGALAGDVLEKLALEADKNPPTLSIRARNGSPQETIHKHPAYQALEAYAFGEFGMAAMSHRGGVFGAPEKLPPLVKYALFFMLAGVEFGLCCPLSMTDALTRTLVKFGSQELIDRYIGQLTSQDMEELAQGSMFMTEQVAGSDVGAIDTSARFEDGQWRLYGDKWFCSNPDAALAMVLARPEGGEAGTKGLTLFLLPRFLPDGQKNNTRIIRLKDKLGTRSMASGEITMEGAIAYVVGDPGAGFKQMTDMINMSRLSNGVRSAGLMRRSVNESLFIAQNRTAFGKQLIDLPLMRRQLVKMLTTAEQARSMVFHTAHILEGADAGDENLKKVMRVMTPMIKFRTCRDARQVAGDAMEVRGGCGYIEEWSDARVLRDAHLGSIWEGTSNIVALDVARAVRREGVLPYLKAYLEKLGEVVDDKNGDRTRLRESFDKAARFMEAVANDRAREEDVRRAATALYNATSATIMAWEDVQIAQLTNAHNGQRAELARHVIEHKLSARDPFAIMDEGRVAIEDLLQQAMHV